MKKRRTTRRARFRCIADSSSREDLKKLWQDKGSGLGPTELSRTLVRLSEIRTAAAAFQPRVLGDDYRVPRQIDDLTQTARQQTALDPVLLFPIDGKRYVLDGHLRVAAYAKAGRKGTELIPVIHFQGTFEEALLKAVGENAKAKLSLTRSQRTESAWGLAKWSATNSGCYSKKDICEHAGVADGTVATMRRVLKQRSDAFDPFACTWAEVLWKLRPDSRNEFDEEKHEAKVEQWSGGYRRVSGKAGDRDPGAVAEAIERAHPRAAALIRDEGQADGEMEREDGERASCDF